MQLREIEAGIIRWDNVIQLPTIEQGHEEFCCPKCCRAIDPGMLKQHFGNWICYHDDCGGLIPDSIVPHDL